MQAFRTPGSRGWGVRASVPVACGTVVVEVRGRMLSDAEYAEVSDTPYIVNQPEIH